MGEEQGYSIELENNGQYVHAIVGGLKVTPEIALSYWHDIIDECKLHGCTNILLEHNFVQMIEMQEMLTIIGPVGDLLRGYTMAFYDRYGHYDIPDAGKKILRNNNVKMQLFHNLKDAERWLIAN